MITTILCDQERHGECDGAGLIQGILRPPHQPDDPGRKVWVTVECGCPCHTYRAALTEIATEGTTTDREIAARALGFEDWEHFDRRDL